MNLNNVEALLEHRLNLKAGGSLNTGDDNFDNHPTNYFVPNFGVDEDILTTQMHIKLAEQENNYKINPNKINPKDSHPINYAVPDFGVDSDIIDSKNNLSEAEIELGHNLDLKAGGSKNTGDDNFDNHPSNYFVPNFGVDEDILDTQRHLKEALKLAKKKSWDGYGWDKLNV